MAIDIPSLFSDIIESPEQKRTRLLTEGTLLGRELTSGLRGYAQTQAPLAAAIAQRLPQQREDISRSVRGMLGVKSTADQIKELVQTSDMRNPVGMRRLATALMPLDPMRAASLAQAADALEVQQLKQRAEKQTLTAALSPSISNSDKLNAAINVVRAYDPNYANQMSVLYADNPGDAIKFAEGLIGRSGSEGSVRSQKIEDYTRMLMRTGEYTIDDARERAVQLADNRIRFEVDPNNPNQATMVNQVTQEVDLVSGLREVPQGESFEEYLEQADAPSVQEMLTRTTGLAPMASELFGRVAEGVFGISDLTDTQRTQYQQGLNVLENTLIRAFSLNDRYPVAEQNRIRENINIKPEFFTGIEAASARLAAVDQFLEQEAFLITSRMNSPETSSQQASDDRLLLDSINAFRSRLYPSAPQVLTVEAVENMSKARLAHFIDNEFTDEQVARFTDEVFAAIDNKLRR